MAFSKPRPKYGKKKKSCAYLLDSYSLFPNRGHGFKTEITLDLIYFYKGEKKLLPAKLQILLLYHQRFSIRAFELIPLTGTKRALLELSLQ